MVWSRFDTLRLGVDYKQVEAYRRLEIAARKMLSHTCAKALNLDGTITKWCHLEPGHDGMHEAVWGHWKPTMPSRDSVIRWLDVAVPRRGVAIEIMDAETAPNEV